MLIAQDVVQQRGFPCSEEAAENGDGDVGGGWCSGHAQGPSQLMLAAEHQWRLPAPHPAC